MAQVTVIRELNSLMNKIEKQYISGILRGKVAMKKFSLALFSLERVVD